MSHINIRSIVRNMVREAKGWWDETENVVDMSRISTFNYETDFVYEKECLDYGATVYVHVYDGDGGDNPVSCESSKIAQAATGLGDILDWTDVSLRDFLNSLQNLGMPDEISKNTLDRAIKKRTEILSPATTRTREQKIAIVVYPQDNDVRVDWTAHVFIRDF